MILNSYFNPFFDKYLYTRVQFPEEEQYPTINPANMKTIIPLGSKKKKATQNFAIGLDFSCSKFLQVER